MVWNEKIKELREHNHMTLLEVANKLGVSESTAQRYESSNGIKNIPYDIIVKYAEIFNVNPAYLMGWQVDDLNHDEMIKMAEDAAKREAAYIKQMKLLVQAPKLDDSEKRMLKMYRALDADTKEDILADLERKYKRIMSQQQKRTEG